MSDLPIETVLLILSHLPQQYLARCLYVCRSWYCAAQPLLYSSIYICHYRQLDRFIKTHQNNTYAELVRHISFSDLIEILGHNRFTLTQLEQICPNVVSIHFQQDTHYQYPRPRYNIHSSVTPQTLSSWPRLKQLSVTASTTDPSTWYSKANQITCLHVTGLLLSLPKLPMLTYLAFDFDLLDPFDNTGSNSSSTNNVWQSLHIQCPSLKTLHLERIRCLRSVHGEEEEVESRFDFSPVTPATSVTNLTILYGAIADPIPLYQFISYTFPNLAALDLDLDAGVPLDTRETVVDRQRGLFNMLTKLHHLKSLKLDIRHVSAFGTFHQPTSFDVTSRVFLEHWLASQQIKELKWLHSTLFTSALNSPSRSLNNNNNIGISLPRYFEFLTRLEVQLTKEFTADQFLRKLLGDGTATTVPLQLETLVIEGTNDFREHYLDIYDYAAVCPELKELTLKRFAIIGKENSFKRTSSSTSSSSDDNNRCFSSLKKLTLRVCWIQNDDGLKQHELMDIVTLCPAIKSLRCEELKISQVDDQKLDGWIKSDRYIDPAFPVVVLDVPDIDFDELSLGQIRVASVEEVYVSTIHLVESASSNYNSGSSGSDNRNSVSDKHIAIEMKEKDIQLRWLATMLVRCRSVNHFVFGCYCL